MRYEIIQKDALELQIDQPDLHELFWVNTLTVGTSYNILSVLNTNLRIGVQGSIYLPEEKLNSVYGKAPLAAEIYLRLAPVNINVHEMKNNHGTQH